MTSGLTWAQQDNPAQSSESDAAPAAGASPGAAGTNIFGAHALPKGLTIVPWKKGSVAELTGGPTRLVEEPLEPIDPDEFRRRLQYYQQAQGKK
ncbi:MAG: hypothetical protein L0H19_04070 [Salinisphaera sp.]|nr:hypothetical protein [Salinisphaera sp.]